MKEIFNIESGFNFYKRKPKKIIAKQMNEDFVIPSMNGAIKGNSGDYIIKDNKGRLSILEKNLFKKYYNEISFYEFNRKEGGE